MYPRGGLGGYHDKFGEEEEETFIIQASRVFRMVEEVGRDEGCRGRGQTEFWSDGVAGVGCPSSKPAMALCLPH